MNVNKHLLRKVKIFIYSLKIICSNSAQIKTINDSLIEDPQLLFWNVPTYYEASFSTE